MNHKNLNAERHHRDCPSFCAYCRKRGLLGCANEGHEPRGAVARLRVARGIVSCRALARWDGDDAGARTRKPSVEGV